MYIQCRIFGHSTTQWFFQTLHRLYSFVALGPTCRWKAYMLGKGIAEHTLGFYITERFITSIQHLILCLSMLCRGQIACRIHGSQWVNNSTYTWTIPLTCGNLMYPTSTCSCSMHDYPPGKNYYNCPSHGSLILCMSKHNGAWSNSWYFVE